MIADQEKPSSEELHDEIGTAWEELEEAQILFTNEKYRGTTTHSYYACFHAARAVLWLLGFRPKRHQGLIQLFGEQLIQTQKVTKEFSKILREAFDQRMLADYNAMSGSFDQKDVEILLTDAQRFVEKMEELINQEQKEKK